MAQSYEKISKMISHTPSYLVRIDNQIVTSIDKPHIYGPAISHVTDNNACREVYIFDRDIILKAHALTLRGLIHTLLGTPHCREEHPSLAASLTAQCPLLIRYVTQCDTLKVAILALDIHTTLPM